MNMLMVGLAIGVVGFFVGIALMIVSVITDEMNLVPMFVGFAMLMICPMAGFFLEMKLNRPKPGPATNISVSPAERMEGGTVLYCPVCHANLGSQAPQRCPECGLRIR